MRLRFITSTPLDVRRGSGTFVGIRTLVQALEKLGARVELAAPRLRLPVYTLERLLFNERLRFEPAAGFDATVGFDLDGYRIAGRGGPPHVAAIKGVIADELRFENGLTRATMAVQARCEAVHVRRAARVITTSAYAARRIRDLYGVEPRVVPELIDLAAWRALLAAHPAAPPAGRFAVLCVCRLYRRKRVGLLLEAAAQLRDRIPGLEFRIVGDGPHAAPWHALARRLRLGATVRWLGDVPLGSLAAEYNGCDLFCLPSVQEGFGIVFLEAMAAGKAIVAARAAAVPEVVRHGLLCEPESAAALAEAILQLHRDPARRLALGEAGSRWVERFDAPRVAELFLDEIRAASGA